MKTLITIKVVIAVIINKKNQVLIAKRASHQHQGDKWEFPGGKVEKGETPQQALERELKEEVDITIHSAKSLTKISHKYTDKTVILDVYEVRNWSGDATGKEGQPLLWVDKAALNRYEFPAANAEILSILSAL
ncbi:MAG: 8-oxo-dGTP diphosphatase MutT [Cocleimonas sp.]